MKKEEPIKGKHIGCLNCGGNESILPKRTRLYNSFGGYMITKNKELFFMEDVKTEFDKCKTLCFIERKAKLEPEADWRCILDLPLRNAEYQRQDGKWVLIKEGLGFA
jgi:hypothetical protein